jgi:Protein of unknown function (DUF2281)
MASGMREKLLTTIEEIPENKLGELLDFMEFLLEKARHTKEARLDLDPGRDPILKYIGGVSHGSLAKNVDSELYGEKA